MERDEYGRFLPRRYQETHRPGPAAAGAAAGAASSPWYGAMTPCEESAARHRGVATALGVVAGASLGAAAMYLLDPEQGRRRREHLAEAAGSALESTTDTVRHAWEAGTDKAIEGAAAVYAAAPSRRDLRRTGHGLGRRLGSAFGSTRDTAGEWLESAREHLPSMPHRRSHRHHEHDVSATTAGVGAAGALLLGLGAMWLFDPARGRGRRAWIGQKTHRLLNETSRFMRATGRHLANKSKGYYHETRKGLSGAGQAIGDSTLAEHVRAGLGHLGLRSSSSVGVACQDGCVTLTGRCIADDVDLIIAHVRETPGVGNVVNQMEVADRFGSPSSSAPTSL